MSDAEGTPGRTSAPLSRRPLCSAPSPMPATQKPPAERRRPRDSGGTRTSDPFAVHQVPRLPRKSHRQSGGDQGTPEGHRRDTGGTPEGSQGVHPTPLQCTKPRACRETKGQRRDTGGKPGRPSDPFAVHQVPRLPRKSHAKATGRAAECVWDVCVSDVCVCVVCVWDMCVSDVFVCVCGMCVCVMLDDIVCVGCVCVVCV